MISLADDGHFIEKYIVFYLKISYVCLNKFPDWVYHVVKREFRI